MSGRRERILFGLLSLSAAAPFFAGRFLPLLDLPQHLGLASVIVHHADPATRFADYYRIDGGLEPYWAYYALVHLLGLALPVELASRLVLGAWAAGVPLAAAYALSRLGRDWRWAVLAVPLVYSTNLFFGFLAFLLSVPPFLLALGLADEHLRADRADLSTALRLGAAAALVFLAHVQGYVLLLPSLALLFAVHHRGWRRALRRAAPLAPSLALFAAWAVPAFLLPHAPRVAGHTPEYRDFGTPLSLGARYEPMGEVLARLPERLLGSFNGQSEPLLLAALLVLFVAALALGRGGEGKEGEEGLAAALRAHRGELLALLALCAYLFTPVSIAGQWYLNPRYLLFAALLAPAFLGPATGARRWLLAPAAALALAASGNAAAKVAAFQRQVGPFAEVLEAMEPGRRVMSLMFDVGASGPVRLWPFLHFGCYYQALRGGDVSFSFAGLPAIPVHYRPGMQAPHFYEWRPQDFRWETMGRFYDYFLLRGWPRGDAARLAEHAVLVKQAGPWQLWRRR